MVVGSAGEAENVHRYGFRDETRSSKAFISGSLFLAFGVIAVFLPLPVLWAFAVIALAVTLTYALAWLNSGIEIGPDYVRKFDMVGRPTTVRVDSETTLRPYGETAAHQMALRHAEERARVILSFKEEPINHVVAFVENRGGRVATVCPTQMFSWPTEVLPLTKDFKRDIFADDAKAYVRRAFYFALALFFTVNAMSILVFGDRHTFGAGDILNSIAFAAVYSAGQFAVRYAGNRGESAIVVDPDGIWTLSGFGHRVRTLLFDDLISMQPYHQADDGREWIALTFKQGTIYLQMGIQGAAPVARRIEEALARRVAAPPSPPITQPGDVLDNGA